MIRLAAILLLLVSMSLGMVANYQLVQDYSGADFFRGFDFFTDRDPTNGHVQFKSMTEANATGLAGIVNSRNATNAIYMAVDTQEVSPQGRAAVRVTSKQSYDRFLLIADIVHMPGSICGVWPAFWTVGRNWPTGGEIDILEGVNEQNNNYMTLHTSAQLELHVKSPDNHFAGKITTSNCAINAPNQLKNQGCAISDENPITYGNSFNRNGGGVFAVERTSDYIAMWFFPRGKFPDDIVNSRPVPSVDWGPPRSVFRGNFSMDDHFAPQQIVFDTTFCGDWAGPAFQNSECAKLAPSCEEYVANNPAAFKQAFWAVNTLQVFQQV